MRTLLLFAVVLPIAAVHIVGVFIAVNLGERIGRTRPRTGAATAITLILFGLWATLEAIFQLAPHLTGWVS